MTQSEFQVLTAVAYGIWRAEVKDNMDMPDDTKADRYIEILRDIQALSNFYPQPDLKHVPEVVSDGEDPMDGLRDKASEIARGFRQNL